MFFLGILVGVCFGISLTIIFQTMSRRSVIYDGQMVVTDIEDGPKRFFIGIG